MTQIGAVWFEEAAATLRRARSVATIALAAAAAAAVGLLVMRFEGRLPTAAAAAFAGGLLVGLGSVYQLRRRPLGSREVAEHLNRTVPGAEESAHLLLADPTTLTLVERLQRQRVEAALSRTEPPPRLPDTRRVALLRSAAGCTLLALLLAVAPNLSPPPPGGDDAPPASTAATPILNDPTAPGVLAVTVSVSPPRYTGRPARRGTEWDLEVEEGASIRWEVTTGGAPASGRLVTAAGDTVPLQPRGAERFGVELMATRSTLYRVLVETADGLVSADLDHRLTVIPDAAPVLTIVAPDQRSEIRPGDRLQLPVQVLASDDHGIDSVAIVATVTKGQGEGVKFREQRLEFATRERRQPDGLLLRQTLDLAALGLEPGDELYFHVLATDHRTPRPNLSRSETVFVTMVDSTRGLLGPGTGVTLNLPPDFFRSQRQLIIDTERLLADQSGLARELFGSRSNDLGLDQGLLRLRYGQFMGDEYEGELVASGREEHAAGSGNDPLPEPVVDRITGVAIVDPLAALLHDHDDPENATLLAPQIKVKLRQAISQMWSAELQLRIAEPRKSLPFQQRALELLQEIRQDARSYVRRVGFDPPPLEPDRRRLAGDLSRIRIPSASSTSAAALSQPALRAGLTVLQRLREGGVALPGDLTLLEESGQELGRLAVEDPAHLLEPLRALRLAITALPPGSAPCLGCLALAEQGFWRALPEAVALATRSRSRPSALIERYFRLLDHR
ncbi:MAG: DUF4175 family protein [Gemmatimonadota bacterium]|nr:DUF4175 family protein [Gemmatimonadota bacterium]